MVSLLLSFLIFFNRIDLGKSFQDFNFRNKTYPGWHTYHYHPTEAEIQKEFLQRTYVLSEQSTRAFLLWCDPFVRGPLIIQNSLKKFSLMYDFEISLNNPLFISL